YVVWSALGSGPAASRAPALTQLVIRSIAASDRLLLFPWGIFGVSSPRIRSTRWLSSGLPGTITFSTSEPAINFSNVVRSNLPRFRSGLWQPMQLPTRIGAMSREDLRPGSLPAVFSPSPLWAGNDAGRAGNHAI